MRQWTKEERYRVLKDPEEIRELHERIVKSDYRQTYHIQPPTGLLNDPNGFVWHDGVYNLFYQWCPWGAVHGLKYWYHTCSRDLVNWYNVGVCIKPDCDMDNKGIYSGSAWPGRDAIHLFYTGNHRDEDWKRTSNTCMVKLYDDGRNAKLPWPLSGLIRITRSISAILNYTTIKREISIISCLEPRLRTSTAALSSISRTPCPKTGIS